MTSPVYLHSFWNFDRSWSPACCIKSLHFASPIWPSWKHVAWMIRCFTSSSQGIRSQRWSNSSKVSIPKSKRAATACNASPWAHRHECPWSASTKVLQIEEFPSWPPACLNRLSKFDTCLYNIFEFPTFNTYQHHQHPSTYYKTLTSLYGSLYGLYCSVSFCGAQLLKPGHSVVSNWVQYSDIRNNIGILRAAHIISCHLLSNLALSR